jgi:hypothetical protein
MPHNFCHLTPQKCSRVFFATRLSRNAKNERTTTYNNKNLQKLVSTWCSRVVYARFVRKNEGKKHAEIYGRKHQSWIKKCSAFFFATRLSKNEEK